MAVRKALGGALVRLGRRIARPTVTIEPMRFRDEVDMHDVIDNVKRQSEEYARDTRLPRLRLYGMDGSAWDVSGAGGGGGTHLPPTDGPVCC